MISEKDRAYYEGRLAEELAAAAHTTDLAEGIEHRRLADRYAQRIRTGVSPVLDVVEMQLRKLKKLVDDGIISEAEFTALKKKFLT